MTAYSPRRCGESGLSDAGGHDRGLASHGPVAHEFLTNYYRVTSTSTGSAERLPAPARAGAQSFDRTFGATLKQFRALTDKTPAATR